MCDKFCFCFFVYGGSDGVSLTNTFALIHPNLDVHNTVKCFSWPGVRRDGFGVQSWTAELERLLNQCRSSPWRLKPAPGRHCAPHSSVFRVSLAYRVEHELHRQCVIRDHCEQVSRGPKMAVAWLHSDAGLSDLLFPRSVTHNAQPRVMECAEIKTFSKNR